MKTSLTSQRPRLSHGLLLALTLLPLLTACGSSPAQQRAQAGNALFEQKCKTEAGIKIYKTVEDVEGIVLLKVRPKRTEWELSDPMWPGAAFAREESTDGYINTFLGYEQAFDRSQPITQANRGYINTAFDHSAPYNLPGYRYVDIVDAVTGKRERFSGRWEEPWQYDKSYLKGHIQFFLDHKPAPAEGPRYGVTYEDHVIPAERALGLASSTVKVLDLKTHEVLGEMTIYAWTPAKPNSANPSPWLTAYRCGNNFKMAGMNTRLFADQILQPRKEK